MTLNVVISRTLRSNVRVRKFWQLNRKSSEETDVLNMVLFGMTAKQWRNKNPNLNGNIRDYATINELICLANLENLNAVFINDR